MHADLKQLNRTVIGKIADSCDPSSVVFCTRFGLLISLVDCRPPRRSIMLDPQ